MKRLVKFVAIPVVMVAALATASTASAQGWGFYVDGANVSFGASSYGYGGYGCDHPGYGLYRGRGYVGLNYRPSVRVYADPYCYPRSYCPPPVYYRHHHHHHHGHGHW